MALLGIALLWPWFAFSYFPRKERVEGARLEARYGERYVAYRAGVPALLPRLRPWRADAVAATEPTPMGWALARYSDNNELGTLLAVVAGWSAFFVRASIAP